MNEFQSPDVRSIVDPVATPRSAPGGASRSCVLARDGFTAAFAEISRWPGDAPTLLRTLAGLAGALGLESLRGAGQVRAVNAARHRVAKEGRFP